MCFSDKQTLKSKGVGWSRQRHPTPGSDQGADVSSPPSLLEQVPPLSLEEMSGGWSQPCTLEQSMCPKLVLSSTIKGNTP